MKTPFRLLLLATSVAIALPVTQLSANETERPQRPRAQSGAGGPAGPRADMIRERLQHLSSELNLTEAQRTQIADILRAEAGKMREMRESPGLTREERMAKLQALRAEVRAQIEGVLDDEQKEKFAQLRPPAARGPGGGQWQREGGPRRERGEGARGPGERPRGRDSN
jgi:Spy/CpxP family protein refolding chaperone